MLPHYLRFVRPNRLAYRFIDRCPGLCMAFIHDDEDIRAKVRLLEQQSAPRLGLI